MEKWLRICFFVLVIKPLLGFIMGVNVYGRQYLPRDQQFILIANHNSHLDTAALLNLFPLQQLVRIRPVAAEDYFNANPLLACVSRIGFNILPIPRTAISKTNNPIQRMGEALAAGDSLILYPEGSRGKPEEMAQFQTGIAHLIQKHPQIPVIPVYMKGMGRSLPKGEFILVPFFADLVIGEPLYLSGNKAEMTLALEQAILALRNGIES